MALLTLQQCKDFLRIQGSAEDTPLDAMRVSAIAAVEAHIRRPIIAESRTFRFDRPSTTLYRSNHQLFLPIYPVATMDSTAETEDLVIVDGESVTLVEDTDYLLDLRTGVLGALSDGEAFGRFSTYPYTVTAFVGLSADPNYADRIEPAINAAILDIVSDRWHRRSAAATNESTGGGVSSSYAGGIPERVRDMLAPFVMARAL